MISEVLKKKIGDFIEVVNEPYVKVEKVSYEDIDRIFNNYISKILNLNETSRSQVFETLERSYRANSDNSKIRQWGRLCVGIADLLGKEESELVDKREAADIVVRLSRWYHTQGNFYLDFIPWAKKIVNLIWGGIENLYYK